MAKISCISKTIIAVWNSDSALFLLTVHAVSPSKRSQEALLVLHLRVHLTEYHVTQG